MAFILFIYLCFVALMVFQNQKRTPTSQHVPAENVKHGLAINPAVSLQEIRPTEQLKPRSQYCFMFFSLSTSLL